MKRERAKSFIIVMLIYAAASLLGVLIYLQLELDMCLSLLVADVAATVVTFIFSVLLKNASVYDPYWSVQPIVITALLSVEYGVDAASAIVICVIALWGVRLTANWAYTFKGLEHQDWRYTMLKEKTGRLYPFVNFLGIHLVPTLIVYACALPAAFLIKERPALNPVSIIFAILSLLGVTLQLVSDIQMHKYRKSKTTPFIRTGLWKYSRHPNYLGEILMWYGVGLYCIVNMPSMWYLIIGAVLNNALFLFVSIPMADGRQAQKAGFEEYKTSTHRLFPIKKLRSNHAKNK